MDLIKHTPCDRCVREDGACMYWINRRDPATDKTLTDDAKKKINIMKKDMLDYDKQIASITKEIQTTTKQLDRLQRRVASLESSRANYMFLRDIKTSDNGSYWKHGVRFT